MLCLSAHCQWSRWHSSGILNGSCVCIHTYMKTQHHRLVRLLPVSHSLAVFWLRLDYLNNIHAHSLGCVCGLQNALYLDIVLLYCFQWNSTPMKVQAWKKGGSDGRISFTSHRAESTCQPVCPCLPDTQYPLTKLLSAFVLWKPCGKWQLSQSEQESQQMSSFAEQSVAFCWARLRDKGFQ